jgi:hypothetical protein
MGTAHGHEMDKRFLAGERQQQMQGAHNTHRNRRVPLDSRHDGVEMGRALDSEAASSSGASSSHRWPVFSALSLGRSLEVARSNVSGPEPALTAAGLQSRNANSHHEGAAARGAGPEVDRDRKRTAECRKAAQQSQPEPRGLFSTDPGTQDRKGIAAEALAVPLATG